MTLARTALALAALFLVFMLGMATAPRPAPTVQSARGLRIADLRLDPPALAAAAAVGAGDAAATSPPAGARVTAVARAAPAPSPPPAPPPPEVLLRQSVAAVAEEDGRLGLVLTGAPGRRLHAGESFMGWRLASVTRSGAVLIRGSERREASFFGASGGAPGGAPGATAGGSAMVPPGAAPTATRPTPTPATPTASEYFRGFKG